MFFLFCLDKSCPESYFEFEKKTMLIIVIFDYKLFVCIILATGIRSQSKPNDIMGEVYRAMMSLGYVSALLKFIGILSHY